MYLKNNAFLFFLLNCFFDYLQFFIRQISSFFRNLILMLFFFCVILKCFWKYLFFWFNNHFDSYFFELCSQKKKSNAVRDLDVLNWANVRLTHTKIYWIYLIMTLIVMIGFFCYTIHVELMKYFRIWQAYFPSSQHKSQKLANVILMTNIFDQFLTVFQFTRLYSVFSDDVCAVWINRDLFKLSQKIRNRSRIICALEIAKTKLFQLTIKSHYQNNKSLWLSNTQSIDSMQVFHQNCKSLWKQYLNQNDCDHMRHSVFNFVWIFSFFLLKKWINIINFCLQKLTRLNEKINLNEIKKNGISLWIQLSFNFTAKKPRTWPANVAFNAWRWRFSRTISKRHLWQSNGTIFF